jgi:ornithine cyclodeaminase/alanine dehydrogenase-like protein (mu-crystallin family)
VLRERTKQFAHEISLQLGLDVETVRTNRECIENSEVIVLATTSKVPVLDGDWVGKGVHINSIGVTGPQGRELDDKIVQKAKIVVDTREARARVC